MLACFYKLSLSIFLLGIDGDKKLSFTRRFDLGSLIKVSRILQNTLHAA